MQTLTRIAAAHPSSDELTDTDLWLCDLQHIDGRPTRACVTPIAAVGDQAVSTIDAMADDRVGRVVQQAWVELGVAQCGYCQAGQIMSAVALLKQQPKPSERQIDEAMNSNICRCGTYPRIRAAIQLAATRLQGAK